VLGGIDAIVLTGTIGERSLPIRSRICSGLEWLGVEFDKKRNDALLEGDGEITTENSSVTVSVVRSREMDEIASIVVNTFMKHG